MSSSYRAALPIALLVLTVASPAVAGMQSGAHATSLPALLADRLLLAAERVASARAVSARLDGFELSLGAYVPVWTRDRLQDADDELRAALLDTVDPAEHDRIEGFRRRDRELRATTAVRRADLDAGLIRLRAAIREMADEVENRVRNAQPEGIPSQRPQLALDD